MTIPILTRSGRRLYIFFKLRAFLLETGCLILGRIHFGFLLVDDRVILLSLLVNRLVILRLLLGPLFVFILLLLLLFGHLLLHHLLLLLLDLLFSFPISCLLVQKRVVDLLGQVEVHGVVLDKSGNSLSAIVNLTQLDEHRNKVE